MRSHESSIGPNPNNRANRVCRRGARETSIAVPEDSQIFARLVNCPSIESVAHFSTVLVNMELDQPVSLGVGIQ